MTDTLVAHLRAAGCVFAEDEASILREAAAGDDELLTRLTERRTSGEPLEHVVGWAEFGGARIRLTPGVFVPRPRTEALLAVAREHARRVERPVVVDLCCGSGALGAALAMSVGSGTLHLHAADVDPVAVACARTNVEPLGGSVHEGDLFAALPEALLGRIQVLVANVPYVPTGDLDQLPRDLRAHEPIHTHDGGADGLAVARRVLAGAPTWLAPGGIACMEVTPEQATRLDGVTVLRDEKLDATVVVLTA